MDNITQTEEAKEKLGVLLAQVPGIAQGLANTSQVVTGLIQDVGQLQMFLVNFAHEFVNCSIQTGIVRKEAIDQMLEARETNLALQEAKQTSEVAQEDVQ